MKGGEKKKKKLFYSITIQIQRESTRYIIPHGQDHVFLIEVAHRVGQRSSTGSRPIIVRFFDRKKRDEVLRNRRNLKRKVFVVGEDLTYANYQVSKKAMEHSATLAVWSSNGRILAKVKNGRIVRLNIHTDLDEVFKRAMYSNAMSADEDNDVLWNCP